MNANLYAEAPRLVARALARGLMKAPAPQPIRTYTPSATKPPGRKVQFDFSRADWSRSDQDNAKFFGCSVQSVCKARLAAGVKRENINHTGRVKQFDFSRVDLNRSDHEIAQELGCSLTLAYAQMRALRQMRRQKGGR